MVQLMTSHLAIELDSASRILLAKGILYGEGGEYDKAIADYDRLLS